MLKPANLSEFIGQYQQDVLKARLSNGFVQQNFNNGAISSIVIRANYRDSSAFDEFTYEPDPLEPDKAHRYEVWYGDDGQPFSGTGYMVDGQWQKFLDRIILS